MGGQAFDHAAGFHAADVGAPAVVGEGAVHVHPHGVGGVHPVVFVTGTGARVFFKVEFFHGVGLDAVGGAAEHPGQGKRYVAAVVGVPERAPGLVFGHSEDFADVPGVGQVLPGVQVHHGGVGGTDEGGVGGGGGLGDAPKHFHVRPLLVEIVVPDEGAVGFPAGGAVFVLVELFEQGALIPGRALEALEGLGHLALGDVEHLHLHVFPGLGVAYQVIQPPPRPFQGGEVRVVDNQVHLFRQLLV